MRAIMQQWAIQIDVTNACPHRCSNCTRLTRHVAEPFYMQVDQFRHTLECVKSFPIESPPDPEGRTKVVGMIGGEPSAHPRFPELVEAMAEIIPDRAHRGLWTSGGPGYRTHEARCKEVFGFTNLNRHEPPSWHQPILVAARELIPDLKAMWKRIWECWLQTSWCASITPRGLFYCEVAATLDLLFDGPGGLPVDELCWNRSMLDFHDQMARWCPLCGVAIPMPRRPDRHGVDDISPGNLQLLTEALGHPPEGVALFDVRGFDPARFEEGWAARRYRVPNANDLPLEGPCE